MQSTAAPELPNDGTSLSSPVIISILGGLFVFFAWPSMALLAQIYETEGDYSHGYLVPIVSAYATYQILGEWRSRQLRPSWIGLPIIASGMTVVLGGYWYYIALFPAGLGYGFVLATGLAICVLGSYVLLVGLPSVRIFFFPVAYLIFAIPFPKSLTLPLTLWLRSLVSEISEGIIRAVGITIYREGNVLYLANASLGVEDACSGIRSFWILMAGAAALGFVLRIRFFKTMLLCLLTFPVSILMNVIRIVVTASSTLR